MATRASNRGGMESPGPEGSRSASEREQPDLWHWHPVLGGDGLYDGGCCRIW
uniref:Uncharacterized protein n=1 Tax=Oryza meridionalis TaxID=40149 RepID=A0A0E0EJZ7_9ORYZ